MSIDNLALAEENELESVLPKINQGREYTIDSVGSFLDNYMKENKVSADGVFARISSVEFPPLSFRNTHDTSFSNAHLKDSVWLELYSPMSKRQIGIRFSKPGYDKEYLGNSIIAKLITKGVSVFEYDLN